MCPLYPLHIVLMYLLVLGPLWFVACTLIPKAATHLWKVSFTPTELKTLMMYKTSSIIASTTEWPDNSDAIIIKALVGDPEIASVQQNKLKFEERGNSTWVAEFNITGKFLGYTSVSLCQAAKEKSLSNTEECLKQSNKLSVSVIRNNRILDKIFTGSVITLVTIIFINFGCALDVGCLKQAVIRPIGPVIGLANHFLLMPLISFGLGLLLFPENRSLRLGFFFAGVSPAGGASNIWTYALGGNLNLSVTMTAVSTIASFALIPMWVFTLGSVIFAGDTLGVPYEKIITSSVGLLIALVIGYTLQLYCRRIAAVMVRILKPFSAFLILFIVIFAIVTNFYLFRLFTWQILVAGLIIPCIGYAIGWSLASFLKQAPEDKIAICIETGVQNTGIAIFLLRFCLTEPASDITTVAPVAVALMTPLPIIIFYLVRMCRTSGATIEEKLPTLVDEHIYL